ncbi:MAG: hypothetical protein ACLQQ4_15120 [Bacteroidia bacterium]
MKNREKLKTVVYKKKYPKSYRKYTSMLLMAALYGLSEDKRNTLFAILDEPPIKEWEFGKMADQDRRITALFNVAKGDDNRQVFNCAYRTALQMVNEKIVLMSN